MTEGDPFKKSSTMMGRGSDTRMYNPRSESSHMYRNNHEEDTYGLEDSEVRDEKREKKLREKEAEKKRKPKHIKIKPSDLPPDEEEDREDDSEKLDADRELSARTGPPGNLGFETSLAMGAKGPGAAAGNMFAMGEPMDIIQILKMGKHGTRGVGSHRNFSPMTPMGSTDVPLSEKEKLMRLRAGNTLGLESTLTQAQRNELPHLQRLLQSQGAKNIDPKELQQWGNFLPLSQTKSIGGGNRKFVPVKYSRSTDIPGSVGISTGEVVPRNLRPKQQELSTFSHTPNMNLLEAIEMEQFFNNLRDFSNYSQAQNLPNVNPKPTPKPQKPNFRESLSPAMQRMSDTMFDSEGNLLLRGNPMTLAWSSLLKATGKEREKQRVREGRKEWRPSTGQFKTPPGGSLGPKGATGRRAKSQRRAVKRGRLTGMMDADKAVEMEHRGVSVKQPMSKFPGKYKEYQGQQEARRRVGQVRVPVSSQRRYGQRAYHAGKTGGGRLPGGMQQRPRIHSPRMSHSPSLPHLKKPSMPSAGLSMGKMGLSSMGAPPMAAVGAPPMPSIQQRPGQQFAMSSDKVAVSDILKARPTHSDIVELRSLVRQMRRALKNKDTTSKGMGDKDTDGAGEGKPKYRSNSFRNTSRPEGATEDATNDSRAFGVHPDSKGGPTP